MEIVYILYISININGQETVQLKNLESANIDFLLFFKKKKKLGN